MNFLAFLLLRALSAHGASGASADSLDELNRLCESKYWHAPSHSCFQTQCFEGSKSKCFQYFFLLQL